MPIARRRGMLARSHRSRPLLAGALVATALAPHDAMAQTSGSTPVPMTPGERGAVPEPHERPLVFEPAPVPKRGPMRNPGLLAGGVALMAISTLTGAAGTVALAHPRLDCPSCGPFLGLSKDEGIGLLTGSLLGVTTGLACVVVGAQAARPDVPPPRYASPDPTAPRDARVTITSAGSSARVTVRF
jgi:hypothetical protein